jgi:hypothetical protein
MIDVAARKKIFEQQQNKKMMEDLFKQLEGSIADAVGKNNADKLSDSANTHDMIRYITKRLDFQIVLLVKILKELKK